MIKCIAVDDEPLALDLLENNISKVPYLECVGKCRNAFEVLTMLEKTSADLLFLDIQMPGLTGVQLVNALKNARPMVIFVTAYESYALEGYALDVVDYLLKPVAFDRFLQACEKAKTLFELRQAADTGGGALAAVDDAFFVHADYSLVKIRAADITHVEGMKDYVKIFLSTQPKPVITRMSLKNLEEILNEKGFYRVHKSYLVNISKIQSIRNNVIFIEKHNIPLSENIRETFLKLLKVE